MQFILLAFEASQLHFGWIQGFPYTEPIVSGRYLVLYIIRFQNSWRLKRAADAKVPANNSHCLGHGPERITLTCPRPVQEHRGVYR